MLDKKIPFLGITLKHIVLLTGLALNPCTALLAQQNQAISNINISVTETTLSNLFNLIEEQSGISFSFNPKKISLDYKINYNANKPLNEVLDDLSKLLSLKFDLLEKQIVVKPTKQHGQLANASLNGYIKDSKNGEALIGATVIISPLNTGTLSNAFGYFSITLPKGNYKITYQFIGYEPQSDTLILDSDINNIVQLKEKPSVLQEIVVAANTYSDVEELQTSKANLQPNTVDEMPALFGEMDVVKSMEFVPGIKAHSDGSTFFYVRGGHRDQNMIMLDDAPIFNASHMLGIFSTVIPDAINSIDIYKGDMPASMGGRLSSVVDIRTKKGNDKKVQVWGNSGLISSKFGIEGPLKKDKSSFLVSGRLSRIRWFLKNEIDKVKQLYFYDLTAKLNFKINQRDKIFFSAYSGSDRFFVENYGIEWANLAGTFGWNHIINKKLFVNTTIAASSYDYFLHTDVTTNTRWKSRIANLTIKGDFTYFKKPDNVWLFGAAINGHNFNPGNLSTDDPNVQPPLVSIKNAFETVLYGQHEVKLNSNWALKYGLRITSWENQGGSFEFEFDEDKNVQDTLFFNPGQSYSEYGNIEPRLGLKYFASANSALKLSFSRNVQNLHLITNSISPFTSLEVWLPSSLNIKPQISNQVVVGYSQQWPDKGLNFTAEGYYKKMYNQIDYQPHAETLLNPLLEGELLFGEARAYGLELMLKKPQGRLRGWMGYTYSRAKRTFEEINNGKSFNAFYDRPHEIDIVGSYDITPRINAGLNWIYYTGSPYSSPISFYYYNGLEVPIYGEKNNSRLPDYHRLDVSFNFKLNKPSNNKFNHDLTLSFYNIYGRKNTLFINYNKIEDINGDLKIPSNLLENNRVTSQTYLFRFTPSLTYNFRIL